MSAPAFETITPLDSHGARVQTMFTRIAHGYDLANRWMSLGIDRKWRKVAVSKLLPTSSCGASASLFDLCAGTLDSTKTIHHRYPQASITAGDFSAGMLEEGVKSLSEAEQSAITPQALDAHHLPFADDVFDGVFCGFGVRNLSDLQQATREQWRCLKPGGTLVVLDFFRPERLVPALLHNVYNRTVLPVVGFLATRDLPAYLYLPRSMGRFLTATEYQRLLREHGFCDVRQETLTLGMAQIIWAKKPAQAN